MMRTRYKPVLLILALCGCDPPAERQPEAVSFSGTTLRVAIPDHEGLREWIEEEQGEWQAESDAALEIEVYEPNALPDRLSADVVVFPSTLTGRLADQLVELTGHDTSDYGPAIREFLMHWNGKLVAVPLVIETPLLYYRSDLLEDEQIREVVGNLRADAQLALTWDDLDKIASHFDGKDLNMDGNADHGLVVTDRGDLLISRAAAVGKPAEGISFYFDFTTFDPLLDSPHFVRSLEAIRSGAVYESSLDVLIRGEAALAIAPSTSILRVLGARSSPWASKIRCAAIPSATEVYDRTRRNWSEKPNLVPVWSATMIAALNTSQNSDAARHYLQFMLDRKRSDRAAVNQKYALGAARLSQFADLNIWATAQWPPPIKGWLRSMQRMATSPNAVARLRIRGAEQYEAAIRNGLEQSGPSSSAILQDVADQMRNTTDKLGIKEQSRQYRYNLGLPVLD